MPYSKHINLDAGEAAGAWYEAIAKKGLRVPFSSESSASAFRYSLNQWRAVARERGHEMAQEADCFMVRKEKGEDGTFFIVLDLVRAERRFFTPQEKMELLAAEEAAKKFLEGGGKKEQPVISARAASYGARGVVQDLPQPLVRPGEELTEAEAKERLLRSLGIK